MHELVLDSLRAAPVPHALARWPSDDGALLALFAGPGAPRWIAKTAAGAPGCRRLRAEAEALARLEPCAVQLGIPRLLGWADSVAPDSPTDAVSERQCCLIQSGLAGQPADWRLDFDRPAAAPPEAVARALNWLERFQRIATPLMTPSGPEQTAHLHQEIALDPEPEGWSALLLPHAHLADPTPSVAAHGDFWPGNLLLDRRRPDWLGVVDWSGFGARSPLDDACTLLFKSRFRRRGESPDAVQRFQFCFFFPTPMRALLRSYAARAGIAAAAARRDFYVFLIRRMRWELGYGIQSRSREERSHARQDWGALIGWLENRRWPDPFLTP